jgi:hypothetical protein
VKLASKADEKLMEKIMESGTFGDKLSALTVQVKDSPLNSFHIFPQLFSLFVFYCKYLINQFKQEKNSKKHCLQIITTIKTLLSEFILPKVKPGNFSLILKKVQNPTNEQLLNAYLSQETKRVYDQFLNVRPLDWTHGFEREASRGFDEGPP